MRRPQFSVATLLLTIAAIAVLLALMRTTGSLTEIAFVAITTLLLGFIGVGLAYGRGHCRPFCLGALPPLFLSMLYIRLEHLRRLEIIAVDDEDATQIAQCSRLTELSISDGTLTNAGLMLLGKLRLRSISIHNCHVTEEGITAFRSSNPHCDIWLNGHWRP